MSREGQLESWLLCNRNPSNELPGTVADEFVDGLVRRDSVEPFGLALALLTQEVNQIQGFTPARNSGVHGRAEPGFKVAVLASA